MVYQDDAITTQFMGMWRSKGNPKELVLAIVDITDDGGDTLKTNYEYRTESGFNSLRRSSRTIDGVYQSSTYNGWKGLGAVKTATEDGYTDYTFFATFSRGDGTGEEIFKFRIQMGGVNASPQTVHISFSANLGHIMNSSIMEAVIIKQSQSEYFMMLPALIQVKDVPSGQVYVDKYFYDPDNVLFSGELTFFCDSNNFIETVEREPSYKGIEGWTKLSKVVDARRKDFVMQKFPSMDNMEDIGFEAYNHFEEFFQDVVPPTIPVYYQNMIDIELDEDESTNNATYNGAENDLIRLKLKRFNSKIDIDSDEGEILAVFGVLGSSAIDPDNLEYSYSKDGLETLEVFLDGDTFKILI